MELIYYFFIEKLCCSCRCPIGRRDAKKGCSVRNFDLERIINWIAKVSSQRYLNTKENFMPEKHECITIAKQFYEI